jgi:hypothetical protein
LHDRLLREDKPNNPGESGNRPEIGSDIQYIKRLNFCCRMTHPSHWCQFFPFLRLVHAHPAGDLTVEILFKPLKQAIPPQREQSS